MIAGEIGARASGDGPDQCFMGSTVKHPQAPRPANIPASRGDNLEGASSSDPSLSRFALFSFLVSFRLGLGLSLAQRCRGCAVSILTLRGDEGVPHLLGAGGPDSLAGEYAGAHDRSSVAVAQLMPRAWGELQELVWEKALCQPWTAV